MKRFIHDQKIGDLLFLGSQNKSMHVEVGFLFVCFVFFFKEGAKEMKSFFLHRLHFTAKK